jgi:hypothetical protein
LFSSDIHITAKQQAEKAATVAAFYKKFPKATPRTLQYLEDISKNMGVRPEIGVPPLGGESGFDGDARCLLPKSTAVGFAQFIEGAWANEYLVAIRDDQTGLREVAFTLAPRLKELVGYVKQDGDKFVFDYEAAAGVAPGKKRNFSDREKEILDGRADHDVNAVAYFFSVRQTIGFWKQKFGNEPPAYVVWLRNIVGEEKTAMLYEAAQKTPKKKLQEITYGKKGPQVIPNSWIKKNWLFRGAGNVGDVFKFAQDMTGLAEQYPAAKDSPPPVKNRAKKMRRSDRKSHPS